MKMIPFSTRRPDLQAGLIFLLILLAYLPVMKAGFVWDDDSYVTENPTLTSLEGLGQIWFKPTATPQYYPLVFTGFWVEHKLWGLNPLGYHLVNVLLHGLSAVVFWWVLRSLQVPGAWVAAVVFALHPVHVESVAWVTERKNVLSGLFYFFSVFCLVRFYDLEDRDRGGAETGLHENRVLTQHQNPPQSVRPSSRQASFKKGGLGISSLWKRGGRGDLKNRAFLKHPFKHGLAEAPEEEKKWWYGIGVFCFICALLSKTVTCSLPAAMVLVLWWKRGRIKAREAAALVPFFALGLGSGLLTAWLERIHVGAQGMDWQLSFVERCLIAGRALWFYAGKLVWPANLTFNYPRWEINGALWWQYVFPIGVLFVLFFLWRFRQRLGRGPLAAVLFFCGTLFPALGFFDVYPFLYSFVADHFQYLASVGLIVLATGACAQAVSKQASRKKGVVAAMGVVVVTGLGIQTWRQCHAYNTLETLWTDTLAKNPSSWMAHNNLGNVLVNQGKDDEAIEHFRKALRIKPDDERAHTNLGSVLARQGKVEEAVAHYDKALQIKPNLAETYYALGIALEGQGRVDEAVSHFSEAVRIKPDYAEAHSNLGVLLTGQGRFREATSHFSKAVQVKPEDPEIHYNLGFTLSRTGKLDEAINHLSRAVQIAPDHAEARTHLGAALAQQGNVGAAVGHFSQVVRLTPDSPEAHMNLSQAHWMLGDEKLAMEEYNKVRALDGELARELKAWMQASGVQR
jgi:Flp pilus assembly protein TadD